MNKEAFLRKDWQTYKPKFKLLCPLSEFSVKSFGSVNKFPYLSKIIEIKEL